MPRTAAQVFHTDELVEGEQQRGQVILHHGDPAYRRGPRDDPRSLPPAEALFLRIVAYLGFAETVCIPARYILASAPTFEAVKLAQPLLQAGLLRPERRAEAASFQELADQLNLGEAEKGRGAWLDQKAKSTRAFRSLQLGDVYRQILHRDLAPIDPDDLKQGGLRRTLRSEIRNATATELDRAHEAYATVTDRTPEAFINLVTDYAPKAGHATRQWAMARYYLTPTAFDSLNTRELPRSAAKLLVNGGVLDPELVPTDIPAPAEAMYGRLSLGIQAHDVRSRARAYCEAVMTVRERIPQARTVFADIAHQAELGPVSGELAELMRAELNRQEGVRRSSGHMFTLVSSLAGAGVGLAAVAGLDGQGLLNLDPAALATGTSVVTGVAGGVAGNAALDRWQDWRDRRGKPWVVAIDALAEAAPKS